jgi:hypothetical protein
LIVRISTCGTSALKNDAKYIGLDVHQATISAAVLDSAGKLVMEAIPETKAWPARQFARDLRKPFLDTMLSFDARDTVSARITIHDDQCRI